MTKTKTMTKTDMCVEAEIDLARQIADDPDRADEIVDAYLAASEGGDEGAIPEVEVEVVEGEEPEDGVEVDVEVEPGPADPALDDEDPVEISDDDLDTASDPDVLDSSDDGVTDPDGAP